MAKFVAQMPDDVMSELSFLFRNSEKIFGEMTKAGAKVVQKNVKANAPTPDLAKACKVSKVYKTPSDDGINTKVYFTGYYTEGATWVRRGRKGGAQYGTRKGIPFAFLAMVTEYGTSPRFTNSGAYRGYIGKKPFFRKAWRSDEIEAAMLKVQELESRGILTNE